MTERKRRVAAVCVGCWNVLRYDEELTTHWSGPRQCVRCGKICQEQGGDFRMVWYPPPNAIKEPLPVGTCHDCGQPVFDDGTDLCLPLCAAVRDLRERVEELEAWRRVKS